MSSHQDEQKSITGFLKSHPLTFALSLLVGSIVSSIVVEFISKTWFPNSDHHEITNALLIFVATELGFVLYQMLSVEQKTESLEHNFDEKAALIKKITLQNQHQYDMTNNLTRIFQFHGRPAHDAVREALIKMIGRFKVEQNHIEFESEHLTRETYIIFWDTMIDAQRRARMRGAENITAFVTHSASVRLWAAHQFDALIEAQKEFIKEGGSIYRILVHNKNNPDTPEEYAKVIRRMKAIGIRTYHLEITERGPEPAHNYLLTSFDGEYYVNHWRTDWDTTGYFGHISGSIIEVGKDVFRDYWRKWTHIVMMLRDKAVEAPDEIHDELADVPTEEDLIRMNQLP